MHLVLYLLLLQGSIICKYLLEMLGKIRELDRDWRVAISGA